jgi:Protein of unknown function (DUF3843)
MFNKQKKTLLVNPNQITMADWLKHTPYVVARSNYDSQFLPLCNQVLRILNDHKDWFRGLGITIEKSKQLAIALVAYFEDFISEIGIWDVFIKRNKALYGYYLPFYDMEEYDHEYLNASDFAYIIYHFAQKQSDTTLYNPSDVPLEIGNLLFDLLEPKIETINATDFYTTYLVVQSNDYFFDLKEKFTWFATKSYLFQLETASVLANYSDPIIKGIMNKEIPIDYFDKFVYQIVDDVIYSYYSSFSALNTITWFSEIAIADDATKRAMLLLAERHKGAYLYKSNIQQSFLYVNMETKKEYLVYRQSIDKGKSNIIPNTTILNTALVWWDGKWWQTGMSSGVNKSDYKKPLHPAQSNPWTYTAEMQQKLYETVAMHYNDFVEFFGSPLYIGKNVEDTSTQQIKLVKFQNEKRKQEAPSPNSRVIDYNDILKTNLQQNLRIANGNKNAKMGLFYQKGSGVIVAPELGGIVEKLQNEGLSVEGQNDLFFSLAIAYKPCMVEYLLQHYPTHNILYPMDYENKQVTSIELLPYFWRFFQQEEFSPLIPDISFA